MDMVIGGFHESARLLRQWFARQGAFKERPSGPGARSRRNRASALAAAGAEVVTADLDSDDWANLELPHGEIDYVVLQLVAGDDGRHEGRRDMLQRRRMNSQNQAIEQDRHIVEDAGWHFGRPLPGC
jgi:hypothetical protein